MEAARERVGTAGDAVGEVPKACQDARRAFSDWLNGSLDMEKATGNVVTDSLFVNVRVSTIRVSGGGSVEEINRLLVKLNASVKAAQQKVVRAIELYQAFSTLFNACRAVKGVKLPPLRGRDGSVPGRHGCPNQTDAGADSKTRQGQGRANSE